MVTIKVRLIGVPKVVSCLIGGDHLNWEIVYLCANDVAVKRIPKCRARLCLAEPRYLQLRCAVKVACCYASRW